ncbi:MAG TPA: hypothetical protein VG940_08440 [Gemmatimonadales bacterium]|nr:hypothetical protein [Gemmatimonadales bacterium]
MRVRGLSLTLALLAAPAVAAAQSNPQCTPYNTYAQAENLCNAAVDATHYFHPLLGLAISGGNPVVGSFKTFGGLGHLSIGIRATAFEASVPDLSYDGSTATVPEGDKLPLGAPTIDAGLGLFNGLSNGMLSVDLLASVVAVPTNIDNLSVDPDASTIGDFAYHVGWGARVGVIRQAFPIPAVTVSYMKREIPTVQFGDVPGGDNYSYRIGVESKSLRATVGYNMPILSIGVGLGKDTYTGDATIQFDNPDPSNPGTETINIGLDQKRTTLFADVGINLGPLKFAGEVGMQTTNDLKTASDFEGIDVNEGLKYASAGIRIAF